MRRLLSLLLVTLVLVPAAAAYERYGIEPTAIDRATLGLTAAEYRKLLGVAPLEQLQGSYQRLTFPKRKVSVYLRGGKGMAIVTWNKQLGAASGAAPCLPTAELKSIYGSKLVPLKALGQVVGYRYGNLSFMVIGGKVRNVILTRIPSALQLALNSEICQ